MKFVMCHTVLIKDDKMNYVYVSRSYGHLHKITSFERAQTKFSVLGIYNYTFVTLSTSIAGCIFQNLTL